MNNNLVQKQKPDKVESPVASKKVKPIISTAFAKQFYNSMNKPGIENRAYANFCKGAAITEVLRAQNRKGDFINQNGSGETLALMYLRTAVDDSLKGSQVALTKPYVKNTYAGGIVLGHRKVYLISVPPKKSAWGAFWNGGMDAMRSVLRERDAIAANFAATLEKAAKALVKENIKWLRSIPGVLLPN